MQDQNIDKIQLENHSIEQQTMWIFGLKIQLKTEKH